MSAYAALAILIAGLMAGAAVVWLLRGREIHSLQDQFGRAEVARADAEARRDSLLQELQNEKVAHAALAAGQVIGARAHEKELADLLTLRGEIETKLQALATEALKGNQASFLALAEQTFEKHKQATAGLLEQKEKAIEGLLAPINTSLTEYRKGLAEIERAREAAYGALTTRLQEVVRAQDDASRETRKLVTALRSPQTRGRWGEQQLKNVIELAGMTNHVDYLAQPTIETDDKRLRPDLVIRVPGNRLIVVDVKTPLLAYLDAAEEGDEALREDHLRRHAQQLRNHMKQLSDKRYWEALLPLTPDFVVMFVPGENFYAAAAERDPNLFEDSITSRVLIVTPTTLIALARTIANSWQQAKLTEDARKVATLGRDLYRRLSVMSNHIMQLGSSLKHSVDHYNKFIGSLEVSVMPGAREFTKLPIGVADELPELKPIELAARQVRPDRDLIIPVDLVSETEALPAAE